MNNDNQLTFIDILSILSFIIGLQNLELNITQNDMDDQTREIDRRASNLVSDALEEIHTHLQEQDAKIDRLLEEVTKK